MAAETFMGVENDRTLNNFHINLHSPWTTSKTAKRFRNAFELYYGKNYGNRLAWWK